MLINKIQRIIKVHDLALLSLIVFCQNGMTTGSAANNSVYFVPQHSSAPRYGDCVDVDIEYDPNCVHDCSNFGSTGSGWQIVAYSCCG